MNVKIKKYFDSFESPETLLKEVLYFFLVCILIRTTVKNFVWEWCKI